jgi:hypothetical protein
MTATRSSTSAAKASNTASRLAGDATVTHPASPRPEGHGSDNHAYLPTNTAFTGTP